MGKDKYIIGIDEVGRGSLAGPVTVAAVALPLKLKTWKSNLLILKSNTGRLDFPKLKDSKKLSPRQREIWFDYIKKHPKIFYAVANVSPKIIDKINISQAANLAATRTLYKLLTFLTIVKNVNRGIGISVFLDGGLYVKKLKIQSSKLKIKNFKIKTIVRGDEKIPAIMLASIAAKVSRDKLMCRYGKKFPQYGFAQHKGYGTKRHFRAIKKYGPSKIHRLTFLRKIIRIKQKDKLF